MQNNGNRNPWLSIPASDYEAHMGDSGAKQLTLLSGAFKELLAGKSFRVLVYRLKG
jgi:hypothetical protein